MSQSIRISSGFGPTSRQFTNNTFMFQKKHTDIISFPIISVEKFRKRAWISVSNHNSRPRFLCFASFFASLFDDDDDEWFTSDDDDDEWFFSDINNINSPSWTGTKRKNCRIGRKKVGGVIPTFFKGLWDWVSNTGFSMTLKPEKKPPPTPFEIWQAKYVMKTGADSQKIDEMKKKITEKQQKWVMRTGTEMLLRLKSAVRITTGSEALDELLGGGIQTMTVTEAFGESLSGKTQLAHTLCVTTQLPINMHGGNGKVAFIDTQGTFQPDRIVPIAERFGLDAGVVMDNIVHFRAYTYEDQYNLLLGLGAIMSEEPFRLLIVDSVIALFRDFELAECQLKLYPMLSLLTKITMDLNVAVYVTNQLIADAGEGMFISDPNKPAGGDAMDQFAKIRLMFRKGKGEQRVCKVYKAFNLPEAEAIFQITPGGIADAKD